MIRIRKPNGSIVEVEDACFVEVTDDEGRVVEITFTGSNFELKRINHASGETADSYAKLYGVEFIDKVINI